VLLVQKLAYWVKLSLSITCEKITSLRYLQSNFRLKLAESRFSGELLSSTIELWFQIDVDIGSSSVARSVVGLVLGYVTSVVVDLAILIEVLLLHHAMLP